MNKELNNEMEDELRSEYDFAQIEGGVRGKYVDRYRAGTNLVRLAPDVAAAFPDEEAVNSALRMLINVAQRYNSNH
ncbi:hypothetical protein FRE64_11945 [Euhalothece natronophila Z-M001]|uniref:Uncharacterized protein n=1 Tax=Euhalothece natronophila Z-M001 TaxID=522448 RepID=A0A5B8NMU6_9CHRO|nr:hypothetical protein [Euhalothece natronophila]QDZ40602.1 hypothetical protein FRE64_11945 [Euhalothece natronophila Z-M001]